MNTETLKVLVTDDEEGMRLGVERSLRGYITAFNDLDLNVSYEVDTASTGEEALEKLESFKYDILLLDYKLPGINGIEVLEQCQKNEHDMLVVMMTAYASLDIAVTATKMGAFDFLAKPFTPQELRSKLRNATKSQIFARQARKLAEEKKRLRFEFISVLSHELKAPIGAVEGYLRLIQSDSVKDKATMDHVINRSIVRLSGMRKLIFDLLDLTRIEAGTKKRNIEPVDLIAIFKDSMELHENSAKDREISISIKAPDKVFYDCDKSELEIIINNLVSNSIKYNRDQGKVEILLEEKEEEIILNVSDTGIGMTSAEQKKLFGEFVRMKNAHTRNIEGSGLGLSTVKKIVNLYGGKITAQSEFEKGTTFSVLLPKIDPESKSDGNA